MASIVEFVNKQGRKRWRVHALVDGTMRHPEYRRFEDACLRLYQEEAHRFQDVTPESFIRMRDFTVQKAIYFWLGHQWEAVLNGRLSESSWRCAEREIGKIGSELMSERVVRVSAAKIKKCAGDRAQVWLRAVFNFLQRTKVLAFNPCPELPRRVRKKAVPPQAAEIQRVFDLAEKAQEKMFVYLCAVLGLRTGEALALKREDVHGDSVFVRRHLTSNGISEGTKRNEGRVIKVPSEFFSMLHSLDEKAEYLVYSDREPSKPVALQSFRAHRMNALYKRAGVTFSNHTLRHFAAANWLAEGRTIKELQQLLGHTDEMTTLRIYGHLINAPRAVKNTLRV